MQIYPDSCRELPQEGPIEEGEEAEEKAVRLADDGFCRLCTAIHDPSVRVRALAAALLGSLHQVRALPKHASPPEGLDLALIPTAKE